MTDRALLNEIADTLEEILAMLKDPDSDEYFAHANIERRLLLAIEKIKGEK